MYLTVKNIHDKYPNISSEIIVDIYCQAHGVCLAKLNEVIVEELQRQQDKDCLNKEVLGVLISMRKRFKE
jgi:hypothetical protein